MEGCVKKVWIVEKIGMQAEGPDNSSNSAEEKNVLIEENL